MPGSTRTHTHTHTHLFRDLAAVVKVIKSENPFLAVVILHRNITLQILCEQKKKPTLTRYFPHCKDMTAVFSFQHRGQQSTAQTTISAAYFRVLQRNKCFSSFTKERGRASEKTILSTLIIIIKQPFVSKRVLSRKSSGKIEISSRDQPT